MFYDKRSMRSLTCFLLFVFFYIKIVRDELKKLKGIGEKRANYILELRKESPEPFKSVCVLI